MTVTPPGAASAWVPAACLLPTADQPLRVGEFDSLFADALVEVRRHVADGTQATMLLEGPTELASRVQRLVDAESGCCSFFTFQVEVLDHPVEKGASFVELTVSVPAAQVGVLDGLVSRAVAASQG